MIAATVIGQVLATSEDPEGPEVGEAERSSVGLGVGIGTGSFLNLRNHTLVQYCDFGIYDGNIKLVPRLISFPCSLRHVYLLITNCLLALRGHVLGKEAVLTPHDAHSQHSTTHHNVDAVE